METVPLQLAETFRPPDYVILFSQLSGLASAVIGLFIAYQAYRGYRRNDSRPMLFIAIGFFLTLGIPLALFPAQLVLSTAGRTIALVIQQCSQLAGLLTILYALRMEP
ncbi:hypothetical protein SAMN06269185_1521 [Natronoarchaeum philippinense]|uniref:Uncharacterized protein n=1 Tax=Natronoarchaeum philippinense TaxID=558529 RepID=A0A285NRQ7_NATPI|nr:hypothetical protein [Natronoarchaeum philippinense]SNZ12149.1 hypothetical protein SAMN06269185_1521 [Natronoarchaeum philippinense]